MNQESFMCLVSCINPMIAQVQVTGLDSSYKVYSLHPITFFLLQGFDQILHPGNNQIECDTCSWHCKVWNTVIVAS